MFHKTNYTLIDMLDLATLPCQLGGKNSRREIAPRTETAFGIGGIATKSRKAIKFT